MRFYVVALCLLLFGFVILCVVLFVCCLCVRVFVSCPSPHFFHDVFSMRFGIVCVRCRIIMLVSVCVLSS